MKKFKKIILGSSYYSLGMAARTEDCMIIERTQLADPTCGGTLRGFSAPYSEKWEKETKELYAYFEENGAIKNERLNILLSEPLLCAFLKPKILLGADVVDIGEDAVTVISNGGIEPLQASELTDARCKAVKKHLNILCKGDFDAELFADCEFAVDISEAFEPCEKIITFSAFEETDLNLFKMKAIRYLCEKFGEGDARIIQCAYLAHSGPITSSPLDEFDRGLKEAGRAVSK